MHSDASTPQDAREIAALPRLGPLELRDPQLLCLFRHSGEVGDVRDLHTTSSSSGRRILSVDAASGRSEARDLTDIDHLATAVHFQLQRARTGETERASV